ncbi:MAG: SGNH/GDSL hydrolase family protein, partial [Bacteroidota bacterium]
MLRGLGIAALIGLGAGLTLWGADTYLGRHESPPGTPETALDSLNARYAPFSVQHPHPFYGFFFPLGPGERAALSNETITLTPEGFRGAGPEAREGRKLAFLVGGSVAFGFSSSDSTTITGYLNRLQDEYHFVGAGVPSWNTSQSMLRTVVELLPYEPALVVLWGGYNDAAQAHTWAQRGQPFPAGTYESFDAVHGLYAGDLRRAPDLSLFEQWFPRLAKRLRPATPALPFGPAGDAAAARFRDNMRVTAAA